MFGRKKIAKFDIEQFENPLELQKYSKIVAKFGQIVVNELKLARISYQIQMFMEVSLQIFSLFIFFI